MSNYDRNTLQGDLAPVNPELQKIQEAIADQLDRKPEQGQPNQMEAPLDMNSQPLINLPTPSNPNDAARLKDVQAAADTGLPPQDGQDGKFLQTNSEVLSWQDVTAADVGLDQVDNTSDLDKPISTDTQAALDTKSDTSALATVATTGSYNDLSDTPTLGTAAQADVTTSPTDTTAGSVTKVGDFGVGADVLPLRTDVDLNGAFPTSVFIASGTSVTNKPSGSTAEGFVQHLSYNVSGGFAKQIWTDFNSVSPRQWFRTQNSGTWQPWVEILKEGDFGLGGAIPYLDTTDMDSVNKTQFFLGDASASTAPPEAIGQGYVEHYQYANTFALQRYTEFNGGESRTWFRKNNNGTWLDWVEYFTSGNLNVNEFGGTGVGRIIATGYASNSATAVFVIQTPLPTVSTSITIQGTLFLANQGGSSVVDPATPVLSGIRTIGQTVLTVSTTGLTPGAVYTLRASSADGKLTVNF